MEGFLTGSSHAPPSHIIDPIDPQQLISNPKFESWRRSYCLIKGWIIGMLSENVLGLVVGLNSSQEIWSTLVDAFAQESQEQGFHLTHMPTTCKKGNDALEVYVAKFKAICDDLAAIGKSVGDKEKAF
uniref:Retrotransposon gag domain-containing protein n=1 Tax=Nymphaea colorata TaxID=210225 RepID=A0A5K0Y6N4_9MAGN